MKSLKVFDLKNNPIECNDDFRNLLKFLGSRKVKMDFLKLNWNLMLKFKIIF